MAASAVQRESIDAGIMRMELPHSLLASELLLLSDSLDDCYGDCSHEASWGVVVSAGAVTPQQDLFSSPAGKIFCAARSRRGGVCLGMHGEYANFLLPQHGCDHLTFVAGLCSLASDIRTLPPPTIQTRLGGGSSVAVCCCYCLSAEQPEARNDEVGNRTF